MKKVAIWGAGGIADLHAKVLTQIGLKIIAVIDNNLKQAKHFAAKWKIKNYGTNKEILLDGEIEAVHVCTPANLHYSMVKFLLNHHKHVLCEKPFCFSTQEALELDALAQTNNLKLSTNLNMRYHLLVQDIHHQVDTQKLGKLHLIHGHYLQRYHLLPQPYSWRFDPQLAGKMRAVTEIGSHFFDLVQFITNQKIVAVSALFGNFNPERQLINQMMHSMERDKNANKVITIDSEDVALVTFKLAQGAIGSVVLSEISHGQTNNLHFSLTGENKTVSWSNETSNTYQIAEAKNDLTKHVEQFGDSFEQTFKELFSDFYQTKPSSTLPQIVNIAYLINVLEAIYQSAKQNGRWMELKDYELI